MKLKLELMQMTKKNMADVVTCIGVAAILSVIVFTIPNEILSAKWHIRNYGWDVWLLFLSFAVCCLFA